jgi:hypothetical protein
VSLASWTRRRVAITSRNTAEAISRRNTLNARDGTSWSTNLMTL